MRVIDVCAGAGGGALGWKRAGCSTLGVELDAWACASHRANVGPCVQADISSWSPSARPKTRVVVGGPPCQPFSEAGARGGLEDAQGRLFLHLLRIAQEAQAEVCLMENVKGLLHWKHPVTGQLAGHIVEQAFRDHGFHPVMALLNAADFGVPQTRWRVFIVGFRSDVVRARFRWPKPTHGAADSGLLPWVTVRQALRLSGAYRAGQIEGAESYSGSRMLDVDKPAYTVTASPSPDLLSPLDRPAPTVRCNSGRESADGRRVSRRPMAAVSAAMHDLLDAPSQTIAGVSDSGGGHPLTNQRYRTKMEIALYERRPDGATRLQPRDCARLQSFPDDFVFHGQRTSQYRQIGNAIPPLLSERLAGSILSAL